MSLILADEHAHKSNVHSCRKCNIHDLSLFLTAWLSIFTSQASELGSQFQRMRRRLTVTGTNETIDGVSKLAVSEEFQKEEV